LTKDACGETVMKKTVNCILKLQQWQNKIKITY